MTISHEWLAFRCGEGRVWLRIGKWRIFHAVDVRRVSGPVLVLFSDRYASWHLGPFAFRVLRWPGIRRTAANRANLRAERLMSWRKQ